MKSGTLCLMTTSQGHVRIKWDEINKATGTHREAGWYSIKDISELSIRSGQDSVYLPFGVGWEVA